MRTDRIMTRTLSNEDLKAALSDLAERINHFQVRL
jgi:hypothetical protein